MAYTGCTARGVDALLAQVRFGQIRALLCELASLGFLGIGVADDDDLRVRFVLQSQRYVVTHALAEIVEPCHARLGVTAFTDLGGLRRRRRLLHVDISRGISLVAARVGHCAINLITAGLQAGGVKGCRRAGSAYLPAGRAIAVGQI